jgi:succinyl-diaminopimelate desuccinylase
VISPLSLLGTLIAFRTTQPGAKKECLHWIEQNFLTSVKAKDIHGDVEGNPYIFLPHPSPKLLWFAHIDVVPGRDDQFSIRVEGDKVYGRGVKDMKGATLAFLIAYEEMCREGKVPPVSILLTSDEEVGGLTPAALLEQRKLGNPPVAFTPDTGAYPHIVTELKGAAWIRLIAEGKSGHGALPWQSENPVLLLCKTVLDLFEKFPPVSDEEWRMTVTPTQLNGSSAINRIAQDVSCILDVRFPPEECATPEEALQKLKKLVSPQCRLEIVSTALPMYTDPKHPMVLELKRIAEEALGHTVDIGREHGSSDARAFSAHGIPAFLFGPIGGDLHGEHEWLSLSSFEKHIEMNRKWLRELSFLHL